MESFKEYTDLEEAKKVIASVELWNGKKMKKSFKNQSSAEKFIKKMQDQEDVRGYNMYAEGLEEGKFPHGKPILKGKGGYAVLVGQDVVGMFAKKPTSQEVKAISKKLRGVGQLKIVKTNKDQLPGTYFQEDISEVKEAPTFFIDVKLSGKHKKTPATHIKKMTGLGIEKGSITKFGDDIGMTLTGTQAKIAKFVRNIAQGRFKDILQIVNEETETYYEWDLDEAKKLPFKSLEQAWQRTKGDKDKQAKLIKKHKLLSVISKIRPGEIKLGAKNKLMGSRANMTIAGLDDDNNLIFVTNNPLKIFYPKKSQRRPEGIESTPVYESLKDLKFKAMVQEITGADGETLSEFLNNNTFTEESSYTDIKKAFRSYLENR
mgnify:CR=1 FL=1